MSMTARQFFGSEMAIRRRRKGWTQAQLAKEVGYSLSAIQAIEQGIRAPSDDLCRRLDGVLGLDGDLTRLGERARDERPGFSSYVEFESRALRIRTFDQRLVPGLLQTEEYARALLRNDQRVTERLDRQKRMMAGELEVHAVLDEAVLLRMVGGPDVMHDQLRHLLELPDNVMVQVLALDANVHPGMDGPLALLDFDKEPTIAHSDSRHGGLRVDDPEDVMVVDRAFITIVARALDPDTSAEWIAAEMEEYRR